MHAGAGGSTALGAMLSPARHRTPLIGRERPLAELQRSIDAAARGVGSLVLIAGEPGIGKTRLAEETAGLAAAAGLEVAWGRCHEIDGRPPLWPWVQVLRSQALRLGPSTVAAALDADTTPLAQFVPELRPHLAGAVAAPDSDSARFRLFLGFAAFLRWAVAHKPQLLILDDLHWADVPSLRLLEFLSHELTDLQLAVVATYRDADLGQIPGATDLVGGLVRRARSLELSGFSQDEVADFVTCVSTRDLADSWSLRLHELTDGNPFFLDEMLRLLEARSGDLPAANLPLPHGVVAAIRQRLHTLGPEPRETLAAAALLGRVFDLEILAEVTEHSQVGLRQALEPALQLDVIRPVAGQPGKLRFAHALVREALGTELPNGRRAELHRRCGSAFESRLDVAADAHVSEIAHHYFSAAAHDAELVHKAGDWSERAGEQAMRALAFEEAAAHFGRAVQILDTTNTERRCDLLLRLGDASNRAALGPEATAAYEQAARLARALASPVRVARSAIGLCGVGATWAQFGRSDPQLIVGLREALDGLPAAEAGLRARVLARLASELHFAPTPSDTDALSRDAVQLARTTGDAATLVYTLPARLRCSIPEQRKERCAIIDELLGLTGGRGEMAVHAYVWKLSEALQAGDLAGVESTRAALIAAVRELRQARDLWLVPALESQQHLFAGRLSQAERGAELMLAHEGLSANGSMAALALLFLIRREQGRLHELTDGMRAFAAQSSTITAWRTNLALLYAETGDFEAARAEVDQLVSPDLAGLKRDNTWMLGAAGLAGATAAVGTPAQAEVVYAAMLPYDGRHVVAASLYYHGPVALYLGTLAQRSGRLEVARQHLDAALSAARRLAAPAWLARALMARARLLDDSSPAEAQELRREAQRLAQTLELTALIAQAAPSAETHATSSTRTALLQQEAQAWRLEYRGRVSLLKARRGLDYLARLLAAPEQEFHVLDLAAAEGSATIVATAAEAILDPRAKRELRDRVEDLRAELSEAEAHHDLSRTERLRAELEAIGAHLARSLGLGQRDRHGHDDAERARAAVTKALRAAVRQVEEVEPELAAVLDRSIRTGVFCSYVPLHETGITWSIAVP